MKKGEKEKEWRKEEIGGGKLSERSERRGKTGKGIYMGNMEVRLKIGVKRRQNSIFLSIIRKWIM